MPPTTDAALISHTVSKLLRSVSVLDLLRRELRRHMRFEFRDTTNKTKRGAPIRVGDMVATELWVTNGTAFRAHIAEFDLGCGRHATNMTSDVTLEPPMDILPTATVKFANIEVLALTDVSDVEQLVSASFMFTFDLTSLSVRADTELDLDIKEA